MLRSTQADFKTEKENGVVTLPECYNLDSLVYDFAKMVQQEDLEARQVQEEREAWARLIGMTSLGLQMGDSQVAKPSTWYPTGGGTFDGDDIQKWTIAGAFGYGYGGNEDYSQPFDAIFGPKSIVSEKIIQSYGYLTPSRYIRLMAHLESARVRLGGRPICRFDGGQVRSAALGEPWSPLDSGAIPVSDETKLQRRESN